MVQYILFFIVIALSNIIQGITGFAGTIFAMPFSLMLVGYPVAKPILNVLAIFSGGYVAAGNRKYIDKKVLLQVCLTMLVGIVLGIFIKDYFAGREQILQHALGIFIIILGIEGLIRLLTGKESKSDKVSILTTLLLPLAGIIHGIFVSGGPLLIGYMTKKIKDSRVFRATISMVWVVLNIVIFIDDCRNGYWDWHLALVLIISVPFLLLGMKIGGILFKKMNQRTFMIITYILLIISGISLLLK
ncbi:MAG: sulfite exporter TauE/SafE family protein [Lachnospiraceae bacterium]|nr:sulfite exporter TauE/SafE family protein [Lachnospiraceae bacterium]